MNKMLNIYVVFGSNRLNYNNNTTPYIRSANEQQLHILPEISDLIFLFN